MWVFTMRECGLSDKYQLLKFSGQKSGLHMFALTSGYWCSLQKYLKESIVSTRGHISHKDYFSVTLNTIT